MCRAMGEMRNETEHAKAIKVAKGMLQSGKLLYEEIAEIAELSIDEVKALMLQLLFMSMEILPVIMNLIIKASKKRSQIHPGRCYERSKKNRDRKHIHTRKSVL